MPNWCTNDLTISGPDEELDRLVALITNGTDPFDFDKVLPIPPGLDNNESYEFCIGHWGTKWSPGTCDVTRKMGFLNLYFDTAWSPPEGVVKKLIELFPELDFELHYIEEGDGYLGILAGKGEVHDERSTYVVRQLERIYPASKVLHAPAPAILLGEALDGQEPEGE